MRDYRAAALAPNTTLDKLKKPELIRKVAGLQLIENQQGATGFAEGAGLGQNALEGIERHGGTAVARIDVFVIFIPRRCRWFRYLLAGKVVIEAMRIGQRQAQGVGESCFTTCYRAD